MKLHYTIISILFFIMTIFILYVNGEPRKLDENQINAIQNMPQLKFSTNSKNNDETRSFQIEQINMKLKDFFMSTGKLPKSVNEVSYIDKNYMKDPVTGKSFDYQAYDTTSYSICATFETDTLNSNDNSISYWENVTKHAKGYYCIKTTIAGIKTADNRFFEDPHIKSVETNGHIDSSSTFPTGFFSNNETEYGYVGNFPNWVLIAFKEPVTIKSIQILLDNCGDTFCADWSVAGTDTKGQTTEIIKKATANQNIPSLSKVTSQEQLTKISIFLYPNLNKGLIKMSWRKIKIDYL